MGQESSLGCVNCADQPWGEAMRSQKRSNLVASAPSAHKITFAKEAFKKMPANEIRNRPCVSDLKLYLLLRQIQIYLSEQWVD